MLSFGVLKSIIKTSWRSHQEFWTITQSVKDLKIINYLWKDCWGVSYTLLIFNWLLNQSLFSRSAFLSSFTPKVLPFDKTNWSKLYLKLAEICYENQDFLFYYSASCFEFVPLLWVLDETKWYIDPLLINNGNITSEKYPY